MRVGAADYVRNDQSLPCASKPFRCSSRSVPRATVRAGHRAYAVSHPSEGCEANAARMSWNLIWRVLPVLLLMRLVQGRLAGGSIKRWRQPFALVARDLLFLLGCCAVPGYGFCLSKRATRHGSACGVERAFFGSWRSGVCLQGLLWACCCPLHSEVRRCGCCLESSNLVWSSGRTRRSQVIASAAVYIDPVRPWSKVLHVTVGPWIHQNWNNENRFAVTRVSLVFQFRFLRGCANSTQLAVYAPRGALAPGDFE